MPHPLEKLAFIHALEKTERDAMLQVTEQLKFKAKDIIFFQGNIADAMYYIVEGEVQISVRLPGDKNVEATILGPGRLFGELSLLDNLPRSATAKAITNVSVYLIPYDALDLFKSYFHPGSFSFMQHFSEMLCRRIIRIDEQIDQALTQTLNPSQYIHPKQPLIFFNDPSLSPCKLNIPMDTLRMLPLFKNLTRTECEIFLKHFTCWKLPSGCEMFADKDNTHSGFIVLRGAIQVTAQRENKALRLAVYGPGKTFGQIAMLNHSQRVTSAFVRENAIVLEVTHKQFNQLMKTQSILAFKFINHIAESLVELLRIHDRQLARFAAEHVIIK